MHANKQLKFSPKPTFSAGRTLVALCWKNSEDAYNTYNGSCSSDNVIVLVPREDLCRQILRDTHDRHLRGKYTGKPTCDSIDEYFQHYVLGCRNVLMRRSMLNFLTTYKIEGQLHPRVALLDTEVIAGEILDGQDADADDDCELDDDCCVMEEDEDEEEVDEGDTDTEDNPAAKKKNNSSTDSENYVPASPGFSMDEQEVAAAAKADEEA